MLPTCSICWRAGTHGDLSHPDIRYCVEHKADDHVLLVKDGPVPKPKKKP